MKQGLEEFIKANREAFDTEEPRAEIWKKLEKTFVKKEEKKTVPVKSLLFKISSVAAIVFLACLATWYFTNKSNNSIKSGVAGTKTTNASTPVPPAPGAQAQPDSINALAMQPAEKEGKNDDAAAADSYNQEIYYYTKLTEVKFSELKAIEKDNPALYKSFAGEIHKLDSAYHNLQKMLSGNADKETILNAMVTNLKMQTEILSKQLYIIHSIKQSKKGGNENKYQSI